MQWFYFEHDQPYKLFYKNTVNGGILFSVTDLQKLRQVGRPTEM